MDSSKFYSQRTIAIATFLGGPLAAGILVKKNFQNMGRESEANFAFWIGISATVMLFAFVFLLPENIINSTPSAVLPGIYSMVIYFIVDKVQGRELTLHEENRGAFHSGWRAAGVGLACTVFMVTAIVGISLFIPEEYDAKAYDQGITEVQKHEEEALVLFQIVESASDDEIITFVHEKGVPHWNTCIKTVESLDRIENLPEELRERNQLLREYLQLRLESYQLIEKALVENTRDYDERIFLLNEKLDDVLEQF